MKSIISLLLFTKQALSGSGGHEWNYDIVSSWSHDYPMCATNDQSPIDITTSEAVVDDSVCGAYFEWDVDYTKQTFKIKNNGHSIGLDPVQILENELGEGVDEKYISLTLNENTIAKFPNYFATTEEHQTYCLHGLHFHWGTLDGKTGSEHLVDGEQYPLEAHFVHYSCDHDNVMTTLGQFEHASDVEEAESAGIDSHQLGVVGILFDVVDDRINPAFEAIFGDNETLHDVQHPGHAEDTFVYGLDLAQIIPDHVKTEGYYAYKGSLTTPPCTDIVNWHVMKARSYIGREQLEKFTELMANGEDEEDYHLAPNYREVQENVNTVYSCETATVIENVIYKDTEGNSSYVAVAAIVSFIVAAVLVGSVSYLIYRNKKETLVEQINMANKRRHLASVSGNSDMTNTYGNNV